MNREFAERLKLLKDFWGNSSGGAYFLPEEEYAHRKEHKKTQETGMPDILLQDAANLVRSFPILWEVPLILVIQKKACH